MYQYRIVPHWSSAGTKYEVQYRTKGLILRGSWITLKRMPTHPDNGYFWNENQAIAAIDRHKEIRLQIDRDDKLRKDFKKSNPPVYLT